MSNRLKPNRVFFGLLLALAVTAPTRTSSAGDASGATAKIADVLKNQNSDGGWEKSYGTTDGDWGKSTIDNGATYSEIRRLAAEYKKTKDAKYLRAFNNGVMFLLNVQYGNGGWPQINGGSGYHKHITYNDDAMINVMILLDEIANKKGDFAFVDSVTVSRAASAVSKGVQCILNTQVKLNGVLTVWGQQHDSSTLKPAGARAYEVPSLCAKESVNIVKFLKTRKADAKITAAINGAVAWLTKTKITGIKVVKTNGDVVVQKDASASPIWARFYELGSNKPIFVGRDGKVKYSLAEIDKERRTGYSWYGGWASSLVK